GPAVFPACFLSSCSFVLRQPEAAELPPGSGSEEISVGETFMAGRRRAGAAAKHHLVHHELAVIFANGTGRRTKARIGQISAACPFPYVLRESGSEGARMRVEGGFLPVRLAMGAGRDLPLGLARKP